MSTVASSCLRVRLRSWTLSAALLALAVVAVGLIWNEYVVSPWTRDGRVRVQVANVAPQVSGQITAIKVVDNQYVHKGDVLYVIDRFDYENALATAKSEVRMRAADLQVKRLQAERRQKLSTLSTTPEQQQVYAGSAVQAEAMFDKAQEQEHLAEINLKRTQVTSPVTGHVTNMLMRLGDYAHEGTTNISVIDAGSFWIDGYFEETKMPRVCVGERAEAQLMGYADPIVGRVDTVTRGIAVSNASSSTQGLPSVDAVYTWVRLAQRVPVRIRITQVPNGVPLVAGMTATVTLRPGGDSPLRSRLADLGDNFRDVFHRPRPAAGCVPATGSTSGTTSVLPTPEPSKSLSPAEIDPGLAPGLTQSPVRP